ncbi:hypothetical protein TREMEDRAFT_63298 [Tremella mesenterica DSM 1558]|uniref:uncharacterized protein n=1 Tax=Tremella mesenterica (strain ATCC 24925 / CBS 8224 / DSM 1558 / NBRC 9311 / NRRL Y-6157 / RJB 2259-6 / UBC 559-6) TaxID=578456 RepID=UPI0003F494C9|nr:uncharacterized protein TREMEDRAFT_63298 [Tremella mesenterica DSM 1558]EIW68833.1 hypothetical protein TREMEDRAFT_63298 [Tremella mesenterica DSM 1558]
MLRNSSAPAPHEINTVWEKALFVNSYAKVGIPDGIRAGCTISNTPPQAVRMLTVQKWESPIASVLVVLFPTLLAEDRSVPGTEGAWTQRVREAAAGSPHGPNLKFIVLPQDHHSVQPLLTKIMQNRSSGVTVNLSVLQVPGPLSNYCTTVICFPKQQSEEAASKIEKYESLICQGTVFPPESSGEKALVEVAQKGPAQIKSFLEFRVTAVIWQKLGEIVAEQADSAYPDVNLILSLHTTSGIIGRAFAVTVRRGQVVSRQQLLQTSVDKLKSSRLMFAPWVAVQDSVTATGGILGCSKLAYFLTTGPSRYK